jgi:general secretion pathway protein N
MKRGLTIGLMLLTLSVRASATVSSAVSDDALDADIRDDSRLPALQTQPPIPPDPPDPITTIRVGATPAASSRPLSANPLWSVPLSRLTVTRDRPIFSPSRRPPPPAVAAAPAPVRLPPPSKTEIEPPRLSLVGTIISGDERFGIFLDQSTNAALRLRVGDNFQGWTLRAIQGRDVTMEKGERAAVLALPQPGAHSSGHARLLPVNAVEKPMVTRQ